MTDLIKLLNRSTASSDYIKRTSLEYSLYVARTRAIPRVNDGLKYGQRVALWLLRNKADKMKTVALSGEMAKERLYVHGDVSATDSIGKLAAPYKNNIMLIKGHGQFGSRVAPVDGIGAPRYTEVSRAKAAEAILYPDSDLVDMEPNYDGSNFIPDTFAPIIPVVLLNGIKGVAVGWSTDILPRSFPGLIQATQDALNGKKAIRGLEPFFDRYNITVAELQQNQYRLSGKAQLVDASTVRIFELPPGHTIEAFRKKLIEMEEKELILRFEDRSTKTIDITVRFKRGSVKGWTEDQILDHFKLHEKKTERIVVLDWTGKSIMTYETPDQLVRDFVAWRLTYYTKRFEKFLIDTRYEIQFWKILKILFEAGFAKKLGAFANKAEMEVEIQTIIEKKKMTIDDAQMQRVTNLATYRWTREFAAEVDVKIASLQTDEQDFISILASPDKLKAIYGKELDDLKKLKT